MCVALGIGAAVAGVAGAISASDAASKQEDAAKQAANTQLGMFQQTKAGLAPYNEAGQAAQGKLESILGLGSSPMSSADLSSYLTGLPGYQFQLQQGVQAIDRSEAAKGLLNSGATGKALEQYGQGLGSSYLQAYVNQLQGLSGLGENAAAQTGNFATQTGQGVASAQIYGGNAAAQGDIGIGNAISSMIGQGAGFYGLTQSPAYQYGPQGPYGINSQYGYLTGGQQWNPYQANPMTGYGMGSSAPYEPFIG
jgi:hypothetical protein